jgi:hypothetical protein
MKEASLLGALISILVASTAHADKKSAAHEGAWSKQADGYHYKIGDRSFILTPTQVHIWGPKNLAIIMSAVKTIKWSSNQDAKTAADEDYSAIESYTQNHKETPEGHVNGELVQALGNQIREDDPEYDNWRSSLKDDLNELGEESYPEGDFQDAYSDEIDSLNKSKGEARTAAKEAAAGPSPSDSLWGVSLFVHDAIKKQLNDPDSYKYESHTLPETAVYEGQACWMETVFFRAKNGFGGYVKGSAKVYTREDGGETKVLGVKLEDE